MPFKETNEGSTHYYGDGCGMPEHNDCPECQFEEGHSRGCSKHEEPIFDGVVMIEPIPEEWEETTLQKRNGVFMMETKFDATVFEFFNENPTPTETRDFCRQLISQAKAEGRKDMADVADDMWGLICNVSEGDLEKQNEEWNSAFLRIREKYFALLNKTK